jgi:hypothetical protein
MVSNGEEIDALASTWELIDSRHGENTPEATLYCYLPTQWGGKDNVVRAYAVKPRGSRTDHVLRL